jgi:ribosomal protein S9
MTGQADAIRLGVARAMVKEDEDAMGPLRRAGSCRVIRVRWSARSPVVPRPASASSSASVKL